MVKVIDKTETQGFENIKFDKSKSNGEVLETIEEIINEIQNMNCSENEKSSIIEKLNLIYQHQKETSY